MKKSIQTGKATYNHEDGYQPEFVDIDLSGLAASMGHKPITHQQAKLAAEFARVLHTWLTPAEMEAVVAQNEASELAARAKGEKSQTCATGNYCDSNMAMDEAMENLKMPRDCDPDEAGWGADWNAAWDFAKTMNFDADYLAHYAETMF